MTEYEFIEELKTNEFKYGAMWDGRTVIHMTLHVEGPMVGLQLVKKSGVIWVSSGHDKDFEIKESSNKKHVIGLFYKKIYVDKIKLKDIEAVIDGVALENV